MPGTAASSKQPPSKKEQFDQRNPSTLAADDREEDDVLDLDEIGNRGGRAKRGAVELGGYESDSSTENFDQRAHNKAKAAKKANKSSKDEEEMDMFADLDHDDADLDEEVTREGKQPKSKKMRFMREDEIIGQEETSKSGGHVSSDFTLNPNVDPEENDQVSSSDSGDDEERDRIDSDIDEELGAGAKKKHAPKLDAFNLHEEKEEGAFDENGNFVRKAIDPDAVHDSWLEGLNKNDMKKARAAQEKRNQERRKKELADDEVLASDILSALIPRLNRGETVLEALQRLGKGQQKKPKWQQKNKNKKNGDAMDVDTEDGADLAETRRKEAVEVITDAADRLMTRGEDEIYDMEREILTRRYKAETGEDWVDPPRTGDDQETDSENKQWEYRWSDSRDGGELHGPYDGPTMKAWNDAGYFGEGVEFRRMGESEWSRLANFV
ncbi:hypothetical protein K402DRAFT_166184 [Aulographum hederae CBS 113979]|uniref:GYF domain-containing protein n=1 Tax=Aulographum hederae CBS 113979 TaxID=1176131 RepID=A0A6G1GR33_9PEZI|nr:hypothetical protein K402DRAFT_166184 [Aulographum hederae CBS 113979]